MAPCTVSPFRRRLPGVALALTLAATLTGTAGAPAEAAAAPPAAPAPSRVTAAAPGSVRLAELAEQAVAAGAPGVVVRVDDGRGRPVEIARQARWTVPDGELTASDRVRMGSNSKTMVATLVLQLVAEHRLALGDPVEKWLPGLVPHGRSLTLRMLLQHTSGLFNYLDDPGVLRSFTGQDSHRWTPVELLTAGVRHSPLFAPGERFSYSNTNYVALGLVLERATGKRLGDLIQQRIARPLGLSRTYLDDGRRQERLAHGYEPDAAHLGPLLPPGIPAGTAFVGPARGDWVDTTHVNTSTLWAAGGVVSTASDWARFDAALMSGKLLPSAQLEQMRTTVPEDPKAPEGNGYGLGLRKVVFPCGTVWGHDGQAAGYSSETYTDASGRRTLSVLTTSVFGLAAPASAAAHQALVNDAVCAMLGKPGAATPPSND
ncbi:serine hydrolase domain-containing protein [Streptomyces sp. NPDC056132]|uniref:serine hydrolase domain-containing protein n=1 Tax=Streptomyces sp. NPDC056132 TaxID=3345722 RepID=UPI001D695772|nr:beta-lactamase family protein [Streptomyces sp. MAG02]